MPTALNIVNLALIAVLVVAAISVQASGAEVTGSNPLSLIP